MLPNQFLKFSWHFWKFIGEGPVDLVGGGGGGRGVEEFVKKNAEPQKGIKKSFAHATSWKKNCNTYQYVVVIAQSILFE